MSVDRRIAFARARTPVAVAMRVVAAALADLQRDLGVRRSVFFGARHGRRVGARDTSAAPAAGVPRGCEDLH